MFLSDPGKAIEEVFREYAETQRNNSFSGLLAERVGGHIERVLEESHSMEVVLPFKYFRNNSTSYLTEFCIVISIALPSLSNFGNLPLSINLYPQSQNLNTFLSCNNLNNTHHNIAFF